MRMAGRMSPRRYRASRPSPSDLSPSAATLFPDGMANRADPAARQSVPVPAARTSGRQRETSRADYKRHEDALSTCSINSGRIAHPADDSPAETFCSLLLAKARSASNPRFQRPIDRRYLATGRPRRVITRFLTLSTASSSPLSFALASATPTLRTPSTPMTIHLVTNVVVLTMPCRMDLRPLHPILPPNHTHRGCFTMAEGGCFCGAVRYRVKGEPYPSPTTATAACASAPAGLRSWHLARLADHLAQGRAHQLRLLRQGPALLLSRLRHAARLHEPARAGHDRPHPGQPRRPDPLPAEATSGPRARSPGSISVTTFPDTRTPARSTPDLRRRQLDSAPRHCTPARPMSGSAKTDKGGSRAGRFRHRHWPPMRAAASLIAS